MPPTQALEPIMVGPQAMPPMAAPNSIAEEFLRGKKPSTIDAYRRDLEAFASFLGQPDIDTMASVLFQWGRGSAARMVMSYRDKMIDSGKAGATINRRLAAIRSMANLAYDTERIDWVLRVKGAKKDPVKDVRGPSVDAAGEMTATADGGPRTPLTARNSAIVWLLLGMALRRGEVHSLDVEHVDLEGSRVFVLRKGKRGREWLEMPTATADAMRDWIERHPTGAGALFVSLSKNTFGHRLTGVSIWRTIRKIARDAGLGREVWPHALRHTAATLALDLFNGDVRRVRHFTGHKEVATLLRYDDARRNFQGKVAAAVAARISAK